MKMMRFRVGAKENLGGSIFTLALSLKFLHSPSLFLYFLGNQMSPSLLFDGLQ
jgi:hypothetical protein